MGSGHKGSPCAPGSGEGAGDYTLNLLLADGEPRTEDVQAGARGGKETCTLYTHTTHCIHIHRNIQYGHTPYTYTQSHPPTHIMHELTQVHTVHTHSDTAMLSVLLAFVQSFILYGK